MSTYEEQLRAVKYDFDRFKTETLKAYQDVTMELVMVKGLTEDSIKRLMLLRREMVEGFQETNQRIDERFDRLEKLIIDRLPPQ